MDQICRGIVNKCDISFSRLNNIQRGADASAARYAAMGEYYAAAE